MKIVITIILITVLAFGPIGVLTVIGATKTRRAQRLPGLDMTEGHPWPCATCDAIAGRRQP